MGQKTRLTLLLIMLVIVVAAAFAFFEYQAKHTVFGFKLSQKALPPSPDEAYPFAFIVLDLDDDGLATINAAAGIVFDGSAEGRRCGTGWLGTNDAFLAIDRNRDGLINNGGELFGLRTLSYRNPGKYCVSPLAALSQEDSNNDRKLDAKDDNWPLLKIWRDLNQDGVCQFNEVWSLDSLEIKSLKLGLKNKGEFNNDNYVYGPGKYRSAEGERKFYTVYFQQNPDIYKFEKRISVPVEIRNNLPNFSGSGAVRSLHEACVLNPELKIILERFCTTGTRMERERMMDELLTAWAATSTLAKTVEERLVDDYILKRVDNSRPSHLVNITAESVAEWDRKIRIIEAFVGVYLFTTPNELLPGHQLQPGTYVEKIKGQKYFCIGYGADRRGYLQQAYELISASVFASLEQQLKYLR